MKSYNYSISVTKFITDLDKKTLINLYQPILGSKACSIYLTLIEESEITSKLPHMTFDLTRICSILSTTPEKFEAHIIKLEGMSLVKRIENKTTNTITFKILNPLEPSDFFDNVIYDEILKKKLDESNYEIIKYYYGAEEEVFETTSEELTWNFAQAFPDDFKVIEENENKILHSANKIKKHTIKCDDELINFSQIEMELINKGLNPKALNKNIKKIILNNMSLAHFNEEEIIQLLLNSYNYEKLTIDKNLLTIELKRSIVKKKENVDNDNKNQLIDEMDTLLPIEYAESLTEKTIEHNVKTIIQTLKEKYSLKNGGINCLLHFSFLKNDGKIVGNYLYKIANTLNKKAIFKTEETMEFLKNANKFRKQKDEKIEFIIHETEKKAAKQDLSWMDDIYNDEEEKFYIE